MGWHLDDKERIDRKRWARLRLEVLDRDKWACVRCGRRGRLEVDHRISMNRGGDPYDLENLACLCRQCHFDKTALENKEDAESEERKEWRDFVAGV